MFSLRKDGTLSKTFDTFSTCNQGFHLYLMDCDIDLVIPQSTVSLIGCAVNLTLRMSCSLTLTVTSFCLLSF